MAASSSSSHHIKGILSVTVLKAKKLMDSDWCCENDCYAVVSLEHLSMKDADQKQQTESRRKTRIHDGSNSIFNEKFIFSVPEKLEALYVQLWDSDYDKEDLLGSGTLSLIGDEHHGRYDTNLDKEWLHIETIALVNEQGVPDGTLEVVLHFIPETGAAYIGKRFYATQAEFKKQLTQKIVGEMTDVASDKIRAYIGIGI
jgi:Ca2+-dependent lipid-binding protein